MCIYTSTEDLAELARASINKLMRLSFLSNFSTIWVTIFMVNHDENLEDEISSGTPFNHSEILQVAEYKCKAFPTQDGLACQASHLGALISLILH